MSQYQPPQQPQGDPGQQPSPFPQGHGQHSYAQPGQPAPQGQQPFGQASYAQPPQGYGAPQGYQQQARSEPGLFDFSLARPAIAKTAKLAYVAVFTVAVITTLGGLLQAIGYFIVGGSYVLAGIASLLTGPAIGFAVLAGGRLVIEHILESSRARQAGSQ